MRARRGPAAPVRPPVTPRRAVPPGPTLRDILDNLAQRTVSRRRLGAGAPRGESKEEMNMDSHGIGAGWPFDRQVDFPLGEKIQLEADAVGEEGGPGESPGGGTTDPGERMNDWRRIGWVNEDKMTGAGWARVGRRLPAGGAPRVMDLQVSSGYPTALGQVDGRTMIRWPLTVRERPPSPHRTMFMDERRHDAGAAGSTGTTGPPSCSPAPPGCGCNTAPSTGPAARQWRGAAARRPGAGTAAGSRPRNRPVQPDGIYRGNS